MMLILNIHAYLILGTLLLLGLTYPFKKLQPSEKVVSGLLNITGISALLLCTAGITGGFLQTDYTLLGFIPLKLTAESFYIYLFMVVLLAATSHFSFQYIHKEIGFYKFFMNLVLFWAGLFLFNFSGDHLVIFAGWELIGISSVFLISYYHYRKGPIISSLYVVSFYKIADILLITALLFLKHNSGVHLEGNYNPVFYTLLVIAGLIKSASFPFTSWLPKAMEGPTPSSAIYYAALSLNTGVLLIYKFLPDILGYDSSRLVLLTAGIITVLYSSFQGRVQNDIKSSLAYSTSVQIGLVLIELAFGFQTLALIHLFSSSVLKIYQFIRTPSLLHIYHSMEGEYGHVFGRTGVHFQYLLPRRLRVFLYYLALNHFFIDSLYSTLREAIKGVGTVSRLLLSPLSGDRGTVTYNSLLWGGYYILVVLLVSTGVVEIKTVYFSIVPLAILLISTAMLFEKNVNSFIALFAIYKILESVIIHSVHTQFPFKVMSILLAGVLSLSLVLVCKRQFMKQQKSMFFSSLSVFMMLFFTNFPFLFQSLLNEHIIEALLTRSTMLNLVMYCIANTFLNLGLYNFVFEKIYLAEAIDG